VAEASVAVVEVAEVRAVAGAVAGDRAAVEPEDAPAAVAEAASVAVKAAEDRVGAVLDVVRGTMSPSRTWKSASSRSTGARPWSREVGGSASALS
jgi:hypothetical protein